MTVWGVHNDRPELDLVGNGFVGIGWPEMGDLTDISPDKDELKQRVAEAYPDAKPGAIPVWAGVFLRFRFEMEPGDLVIYPYKPDSTLNFGPHNGGLLLRRLGRTPSEPTQGRLAKNRDSASGVLKGGSL